MDEQQPATSQSREEGPIRVCLTSSHLDISSTISHVKSPKAGAVVLFAGTTRDSFESHPVSSLTYTSYAPLALSTMLAIAKSVHAQHGLTAICLVHRLGHVPVGEESILIAVSAPHRHGAWRAGEDALEQCKARLEVWKKEEFEDDAGGREGVWRANRDGARPVKAHGEEVGNGEMPVPHPSDTHAEAQKKRDDHLHIRRT
ncbi:MAG: Molybdopterin synthase catalytic subunit [Sclerophora amabilis]|nr:MAG: Molybdopterin synthase catalytic subunit [Sclerophora amabilis]